MTIEKDVMAAIHYTLKDKEGTLLDSSEGSDPLEYLHGYGNLIPGLEKELEGKKAGDTLSVSIEPAEAYGEYSDDLVVTIPRSNFETDAQIEVGMQFETGSGSMSRIVRVTKIDGDDITIDANHELAGKTLFFDVNVESVRKATDEEIEAARSDSCGCGSGGCGGHHEHEEGGCGSGGCGSGGCGGCGGGCCG
ncbi:peptidylprolyl isomerase [Treponema sp. HNW]|uniref:FKBP-type peptidyl-prolyl cis-trans isomerase n=1 Tax=Treponema sp. HNW TaxID=3116654 RepID=UPI003D0BEEAB